MISILPNSLRMQGKLTPLLPPGPGGAKDTAPARPKRTLVNAACEPCREKKTKCRGQRPACNRCVQRGLTCCYDVNEGETRGLAMKRKCSALELENRQFKELCALIRVKPQKEAYEIFVRIRASTDTPAEILRFVRQAELLLAETTSEEAITATSTAEYSAETP